MHKRYQRHDSNVGETLKKILQETAVDFGEITSTIAMSGSGAIGVSESLNVTHVQEVIAAEFAIKHFVPDADSAIEIGGEDAKLIIFSENRTDENMNDTCAGGTGAFIDQMASLLGTDAGGLSKLAEGATKHYGIASRCGVFAKSDIQPLINSSAKSEDIAASIYTAVANQVIGNLMRGRKQDCNNVVLLGGPLSFSPPLRKVFAEKLAPAKVICPENAEYFVALGAALASHGASHVTLHEILARLERAPELKVKLPRLPALFSSSVERDGFRKAHQTKIIYNQTECPDEVCFLGIDAGSTTFKAVIVNAEGEILWSKYSLNDGKLDERIQQLKESISKFKVAYAVAVGYGEDRMVETGLANSGEVETVAHLRAAQYLQPKVSFILDIGGQDMKAIWVKDGLINRIMLNEACSSGCGSFIKTYADSLGLSLDEFDHLACQSQSPVDLGTRCTVFMNSNIKQAQKEGVPIADIAAGLAHSVVNNALYKVMNLHSIDELGDNIVVQGGTLLNDSILRAFEQKVGVSVVRPEIAGLMGAYGAALLAQDRYVSPSLIPAPVQDSKSLPDLVKVKMELLMERKSEDYWLEPQKSPVGVIGIPIALNMYENYPFWHTFFSFLGFQVVPSSISNKHTYYKGIDTIPSGTVCYPAKLLHGHIVDLVEQGIKQIWLPFIKWERAGENCRKCKGKYNCPVVMGYPDTAKMNMRVIEESGTLMYTEPVPYHHTGALVNHLCKVSFLKNFKKSEIQKAVTIAELADRKFKSDIRKLGEATYEYVCRHRLHGIVLAGHPYHIDPEVSHGLSEVLTSLGVIPFTEDSLAHLGLPLKTRVKNQWEYHSRLYNVAEFVSRHDNFDLVQIISFGCGIDAVTSDQVKEILEHYGKIYTQLKVDEMADRRPARIRIRSLLAALRERGVL